MSINRTERFMREFRTATEVQHVAGLKGVHLTLEQAHEAWMEHSDDYCAGWLAFDSESPRIEILQALTKYRERHASQLTRPAARAPGEGEGK